MQNIGPLYESQILSHLGQCSESMLPLISSVTGETITDPRELDAAYWRRNLQCPVLFCDAIKTVLEKGTRHAFLEVGPHSTLAGPLRQIFQTTKIRPPPPYIPTLLRHDEDSRSALLTTAGRAYASGISLDLASIIEERNTLTDLPLYPWQHTQSYWAESRLSRDWRLRSVPHHELLGSQVVESTDYEPSWRNVLRLDDVPWLWDHVIQGHITFPGAGYIAMAGEAVRQLHPDSKIDGYSLQNVTFQTPLILKDGVSSEIITSLKAVELADEVLSGWYTFTIGVFENRAWTQLCKGQVRIGVEKQSNMPVLQNLARAVPSDKWYRALRRTGLEYGTQFQTLKNISAHPKKPLAAATVAHMRESKASSYPLHPIAIDQCIVLLGVAGCSGSLRHISRTYIPAKIDGISVTNTDSQIVAEACTSNAPRDGQLGDVTAVDGNKLVLSLKGCYLFAMDECDSSSQTVRLGTRMIWKPDIDLLPSSSHSLTLNNSQGYVDRLRAVGSLCMLCILETADRISDIHSETKHLQSWKNWVMTEASNAAEGRHPLYPESSHWAQLSSMERETLIGRLFAELRDTDDVASADCVQQVLKHCVDLMNGEISSFEVLMQENLLTRYHGTLQKSVHWSPFLELLAHSNPGLRVLEVGAGTGAATTDVLSHLKSTDGTYMYSKYVFTDSFSAFVNSTKEGFAPAKDIEYRVLDMSRDPLEQGFEAHSFDLIIASNLSPVWGSVGPFNQEDSRASRVHVGLQHTLKHVHMLLAENGRLILTGQNSGKCSQGRDVIFNS